MLRFILRNKRRDSCNGLETDGLYTLDIDVPELEAALCRGGSGESGYDYHELEGVEVVTPNDSLTGVPGFSGTSELKR